MVKRSSSTVLTFILADFNKTLASKHSPFKLYVNPLLPVAVALIVPLVVLPPDVGFVVPVTTIVLPAHGLVGVESGLLQDVKLIANIHKPAIQNAIKMLFLISVAV